MFVPYIGQTILKEWHDSFHYATTPSQNTRAYTRTRIANNFYICKKIHKKTQKTLYFAFFLIVIRFYSQKYSTFAQNFEKRHKNTTKFLFNQIKLQNYEKDLFKTSKKVKKKITQNVYKFYLYAILHKTNF